MSSPPSPLQMLALQKALDQAARKIYQDAKSKERAREQLLRIRLEFAKSSTK